MKKKHIVNAITAGDDCRNNYDHIIFHADDLSWKASATPEINVVRADNLRKAADALVKIWEERKAKVSK